MNNLTASEILKALRCCDKAETMAECESLGCPGLSDKGCIFWPDRGLYTAAANYLQELLDQNIKYKAENIRLQGALKTERNLVGEMVDRVKEKEYILMGVMHSVDKWLEGEELNQDECNRAATMREKVLRIIEDLAKQLKEQTENGLNELQDQLVKVKDECKVFREYYIRVSNLPDCNSCKLQRNCEYLPQWGESVRINCPHFVGGDTE